jgi:hypothetical protein
MPVGLLNKVADQHMQVVHLEVGSRSKKSVMIAKIIKLIKI